MGSSSRAEAAAGDDGTLAPGFRFHPTDEELVSYYLKRKVSGKPFRGDPIAEIDIYRSEPWELPSRSRLKTRDLQWYFFSALDKKYGNSSRTNRATSMGYWKTTGKDRPVRHRSRTVGMKKTLVYHSGRAPRGQRTNWVMHEYRLEDDELGRSGIVQDAFVLCRIHQKSGAGPKNGEQYGAPFVEEEWDHDDVVLVPKEETGVVEDPSFLPGGQDQVQPDGHEQHLDVVAIRNDNVLPVVQPDKHDGLNNQQEPVVFTEEQHEQEPVTYSEELQQYPEFYEGMDENYYLQEPHPCAEYVACEDGTFNMPELLDEKAFGNMEENINISEFCQMPPITEYVEVKDLSNPVEADCPAFGEVVEAGSKYFGASCHDQPLSEEGCFLELDDLSNTGEVNHASGFEDLDDMIMYFDATDDNLAPFDFESILAPEIAAVTSPENAESQQKSKPNTVEDASSSKHKFEEESINDAHYENGWDKSIAKRFTGMLGSIPAPPAFAAEYGLAEQIKSAGQNSNHSGSIQFTAGMFYISDRLSISSVEKPWTLQKGGNVEFLVSCGISGVDVITTGANAEIPGKAMSMLWRAGLYLCLIWVPILVVSFKIGSFIYSK